MKVFFLATLLFFVQHLSSQCLVSGKVTDSSDHPIVDANVVILVKGHANIISFTTTDNKGNYQLDCPDGSDTFLLRVTIIGYASQTRTFSPAQHTYQFVLVPEITELPSVEVKREAISQKGDTVNYLVSFFANKQDRFIGDVISKIPGIEIDANGSVKYNGKLINAYYINGLNLLENRYSIANQNIPFDLVDKVQVFQNHQPIQILDSLDKTTSPALNIELKNNARNRFIGKAKAGMGASPLLSDDELIGLKFANDIQFISTYKYNNTGIKLSAETNDQVAIVHVSDTKTENDPQNILSVVSQPLPAIQNNRYLLNNSHLFHLSALSIAKNQAQFKYNVSYSNDMTEINGLNQSTFYFPGADTSIILREVQTNNLNTNKVAGNFVYELNNKKRYVKNSLRASGSFANENGLINNTTGISQRLSHPFYLLQNDLNAILPFHKKLVTFSSQTILSKDNQLLQVAPGSFKEIFNDSFAYQYALQSTSIRKFVSKNKMGFLGGKETFQQQYSGGVDLFLKNFTSGIDKNVNLVNSSLNDSFRNDLDADNVRVYASIRNIIRMRKVKLDIDLPLEWNTFSINNKLIGFKNTETNIYFNPAVTMSVALDPYYTMELACSRQNIRGDFLQTATGFILNNYRSVSQKDTILPFQLINNYVGGFAYKNPLRAFFYNVSVTYSTIGNNILTAPFYNDFYIKYRSLQLDNEQTSLRFAASMNKYLLHSKTNISLAFNYGSSRSLQLLDSTLVNLSSNETLGGLKINFDKLVFMSVESSSNLSYFQNRFNGAKAASDFSFFQFREDLKTYFFLPGNRTIFINAYIYRQWDDNAHKQNYFFADMGIKQKFKKIEFQLDLRNLTNVREYQSVYLAGNLKQVTQTSLRPRSIMLQCYFNL